MESRCVLEAYLRHLGVAYTLGKAKCGDVGVEMEGVPVPDLVLEHSGELWLFDVKGRRFPSGVKKPQYWRNWVGQEDLVSLSRWEVRFGGRGFFVFVYELVSDKSPVPPGREFEFQGKTYAFIGISLKEYGEKCRHLSAGWQTVTMGVREFQTVARPLDELLE